MSETITGAAARLVELLTQENAALAALDLPRAAAMLAAKQDAIARLAAAQDVADRAALQALASQLQALATANGALLERAIAVQSRVIGVVASAIPRAVNAPRYGARGGIAQAGRPAAFALAARA